MRTKIYIGCLIALYAFLFLSCSNTTDRTNTGPSDSTNHQSVEQEIESCMRMGKALDEKEEYRSAIIWFTRAIEIKSNYAEAYYSRALSKYGLKDFKGCIKDCDTALAINPKYNEAAYIRSCAKPGR